MRFLFLFLLLLPPGASLLAQERRGSVTGLFRDADTGEEIGWVQVLLEEAGRSTVADGAGRFHFHDVPAGRYTLHSYRIGYETPALPIEVAAGDTLRLTLRLSAAPVATGEIVVEEGRSSEQLSEPALSLDGRQFRRNLGMTIAETLDREPGIAMRSMGPAPARPVLRGLGGERLLVLEDGGRTGDLSATSTDHAVAIEPMTADRIEIVRGPAALVYGPNVLGGVVNVVRGQIPTSAAHRYGVSMQGESVNRGYAAGVSALWGSGRTAFRLDGSARQAGEMHTPLGELDNTGLSTYNGSFGMSRVNPHGYAGISGSLYSSEYGIPGGFVGAHPNGVSVQLSRAQIGLAGRYTTHSETLRRVEARADFLRYFHQEFEDREQDLVGIEYGILTGAAALTGYTGRIGPLQQGAVGVWTELRGHRSGGLSFTPATTEQTAAVYGFQETTTGPVVWQAGLRYDLRRVLPERSYDSERIGRVRDRTFIGWSAAASAGVQRADWNLRASVMRSVRLPGIEELFSEGPHLAAYSFEIGNPDLGLEKGVGGELTAGYRTGGRAVSAAVFLTRFTGFIYPRHTGRINARTLLPEYQYTGSGARFIGGEGSAEWPLGAGLMVEARAGYVRALLIETGEPLSWIPPLTGEGGARYRRGSLAAGLSLRVAARQHRLGPFEAPTDGYRVLDGFVQYYFSTGRMLHTVDLVLDNITDTAYRNHLSRVKSVMPEPGRNLRLLYRMHL